MALVDSYARLGYRLNLGDARKVATPPSDWKNLLGPLSEEEALRISKEQLAGFRKTKLLEALLKKESPGAFTDLYRWRNLDRILMPLEQGRPVIVAGWHVGPLFAFGLGLQATGYPLTLILHRWAGDNVPRNWEVLYTEQGSGAGVVAYKQCMSRLKGGGLVAMACDVFAPEEEGLPIRAFGLDRWLKRGFAALACSTGAAIVPVSIRWEDDHRLMFEAQSPLTSTEGDRSDREVFERAVIREYGERLDAYMRAFPQDLEPRRARAFVEAWQRHLDQEGASDE